MRIKTIFTTYLILLLCPFSYGQDESIRSRYEGLDRLLGENSFFDNHPTGFMLFDLDSQWVLYEKNSHMNFIPASTTKLLTFYATLMVLGDSTNGFRYVANGDEITIWGTGDPSWKYGKLPNNPGIERFLKRYKKINFSDHNWKSDAFGYGWQWDDYYYSYSAERSPFPIYGNLVTITNQNQNPQISPSYFKNEVRKSTKQIRGIERELHSNRFYFNPSTYVSPRSEVPFITSPEIFAQLAGEVLQQEIRLVNDALPMLHEVYKSGKIRPLWTEMLQESDNFIAEQLLLMVSDQLFQEMDSERAIDFIKKTYLWDLPDMPQWVDGSGLSRHNLVTPRSMIGLLVKIDQAIPRNQLLQLLPRGGINGTLKNNYKAPQPYVFAKTGTISNNHSLVGILKSNTNRYYAFAFMNNNYLNKSSEVRREMERVMLYIKENF